MLKMEKIYQFIANLLPRQLVLWCFIRVFAHGTTGKHEKTNCTDIECMEILKRWGDR